MSKQPRHLACTFLIILRTVSLVAMAASQYTNKFRQQGLWPSSSCNLAKFVDGNFCWQDLELLKRSGARQVTNESFVDGNFCRQDLELLKRSGARQVTKESFVDGNFCRQDLELLNRSGARQVTSAGRIWSYSRGLEHAK